MSIAVISPCGQYRYRLERLIEDEPLLLLDEGIHAGKTIAFYGVNPSRADAKKDDPTSTKWIGFCQRWGASRYIAGNPFALRSPNVRDLSQHPDPWGADNQLHLRQIIEDADIHVPCWGSRLKVPPSLRPSFDVLLGMLHASGKPVLAFGLTKDGDPMHPLYLPYSTALVPLLAPQKEANHVG